MPTRLRSEQNLTAIICLVAAKAQRNDGFLVEMGKWRGDNMRTQRCRPSPSGALRRKRRRRRRNEAMAYRFRNSLLRPFVYSAASVHHYLLLHTVYDQYIASKISNYLIKCMYVGGPVPCEACMHVCTCPLSCKLDNSTSDLISLSVSNNVNLLIGNQKGYR